ncbi:zinc finger FYVE domain-containing protein 16 isoform X1 [Bombus pascuorum]|uniref:zinc finger FYVE domain-containing protein 16 isoform X1 n=1 Tax=Bombus pascuorum TaxID=65598 RepID=UPI0021331D3D|nr:zinc finger FYVE domain-containing protein 16 isoform X1 [Bombus pascuorum]XP_060815679.1 zinc finger FYVE domain-containing protein 16 isoform X1 [Bombus pascuorum]XP_060815680.1 zinc finger FYVE domain-containing protein 16 isoform X1 [Bombus pascuorum]XP_060815682.1 zinc finger FYVE domain-containing protein 16 isoform X1 [Bombus pascuorum]
MEKFAVDLDKVLDDFEFNEDCAEQIASDNLSTNNASSSSVKCNLEPSALKGYNYLLIEPKKANKEFDIILPVERHKDLQQINTKNKHINESDIVSENLNYSTEQTTIENTDVNQFYTQECTNDNKSIQKQSVPSYDSEQVSLAIYNDISQKVIQKQQNSNNSPKIDNRYDKKLNQSNLKPSVSNVFSSLNEYINAPPGSSDCIHSVLNDSEIQSDLETKVPQIIQSSAKDSEESIPHKQTVDIPDPTREIPVSSYQDATIPITVELPVTYETNIKEDVKNVHVTNFKPLESKTDLPEKVACIEAVISNKAEIKNDKTHNYNSDRIDQEKNSMLECTYIQDGYYENESTTQLQDNESKLNVKNIGTSEEHKSSLNSVCKPIGFSNIDNLSEDELTKYLAELEEEEKLRESCNKYENITNTAQNVSQDQKDKNKQSVQVFPDTSVESRKMIESELNERIENISVTDCQEKETDKELLNNALMKQNVQQSDDRLNEDKLNKHTDILSNPSKELKLLHRVNVAKDDKMKLENECVPDTKDIEDSQEHPTYNLNTNQGSLNDSRTEIQLKEQKGNSTQYNQACELKMPSDIDNISEERISTTSELNTLIDMTKHNDDVISTSVDVYARPNVSDTGNDSEKPVRPQTLDIVLSNNSTEHQVLGSTSDTPSYQVQSDTDGIKEEQGSSPDILENSLPESGSVLGKQPPFWVPDSDAPSCMLCDVKFTVIKRRHHCRACGKVLCNKCCNMKYKLEYQGNIDSRVCVSCYQLLTKAETEQGEWSSGYSTCMNNNDINSPQGRQPNPNNPMEYCSTIPPLQQLAGGLPPPPTVMVPVGVLKREDGTKSRPEISKSVMFSDGIRPGCDLTELDMSWDLKPPYRKSGSKRIPTPGSSAPSTSVKKQNLPRFDPNTESYVPQDPNALPPTVTIHKGQVSYHAVTDENLLYKTLKNECEPPVMFAINRNLYAYVKIVTLNCCVNKTCWNVTSKGLDCVGQDEIILLIEVLPDETRVPKDLLLFINQLRLEAMKGNIVSELGFLIYQGGNFLDSREHAGFLFIRQTSQCLQKIILPPGPYLFGLLVHRWETPWAKVFPLRLVLRLGAEYRYYPCPLFSVRFRDALYFEIGHTVMKVLADFRNFAYTLPSVRGLTIHLRNRMTDVMFPRNRYDQVIKGLNNSNDHVLAYASNFSIAADSHLVCIQTNTGDESTYQTQAISINNNPRTITGTSFIVINGALKSSMGLSAKSSIVEDGLMVEIMPEKMEALKAALKNMQDFSIGCGRQGAPEPDETVNIKWVDNDVQFNVGVKSPIDRRPMDGIPSIRIHNGIDYKGTSRFIRWTEVFIINSDDHPNGVHDPVDINKLSGNIAKATCTALVKLLDLLANAGLTKLGVRTTIHPDNVGYEAGSEGMKLPPIYMKSLDNELIQVLHKAAQSSQDTHIVLELIFYILDD